MVPALRPRNARVKVTPLSAASETTGRKPSGVPAQSTHSQLVTMRCDALIAPGMAAWHDPRGPVLLREVADGQHDLHPHLAAVVGTAPQHGPVVAVQGLGCLAGPDLDHLRAADAQAWADGAHMLARAVDDRTIDEVLGGPQEQGMGHHVSDAAALREKGTHPAGPEA